MTIAESLLPEFDQEMGNTRKVLERVPDDRLSWKPHEKSGTLLWLASHVATMPEWATVTVTQDHLDYAPVDGPGYQPPKTENRKQMLEVFDKGVTQARSALAATSDQDMMKEWTLLAGGQTIFVMPRVAVYRTVVMNHMIHHRAQLTVYFRLLDVPVPGLYGPSADETTPDKSASAA